MKPIGVVTTAGSMDEARRLASAAVEAGLAACAQLSQIESYYVWEGAVQHEPEVRIVLKTAAERYEALEALLCELHSYAVPQILAVDFERAYGPYAEWIGECTGGSKGSGRRRTG